jgi:hypothetical protein
LDETNMDWFERLTGFQETSYDETRARLRVEGDRLRSSVNDQSYQIGQLELASLEALRERAKSGARLRGRIRVRTVSGDVRELHQLSQYAGALFQVASQFNLLEMPHYDVTPEDGVTSYENDRTQGPACAIAAGAATIYRNYFVPVGGGLGQTEDRQFDGLADLGNALSAALDRPVETLWTMRNGYALCTRSGLDAIADHLGKLGSQQLNDLRGKLRIGVHRDVEVTEATGNRPLVSQAFCSALPVACTSVSSPYWEPFATLVLEAAYEATLWAAVENAQRGVSNTVLLTSVGGGAFGNSDTWIEKAMLRALQLVSKIDLDVWLVSYRAPSRAQKQIAEAFR